MNLTLKDDLPDVAEQSWQLLGRGGADGKDPFHTPTMVTLGQDSYPAARTVILRKTLRPERALLCHSDWRSQKVAQLQANDRVVWHFWHPKRRIQLRLRGRATLHHDDELAEQEWERTEASSRLNYSAEQPPSTVMSSLQEAQAVQTTYDELEQADSEAWRGHFCVIRSEIEAFDYLLLARSGHRRAQFHWQDNAWQGQWVVA
jgi:pyridoxamine 5'-phosphate oxidase